MRKILLLTGLLLSVNLLKAQDLLRATPDTAKVDAVLTEATVYFGYGAELTHETKVKVEPGTKIIVINQLSTEIDINSLQISCPEDVALLSHHYNLFEPEEVVVKNKEADRLQDTVILLQKDIARIDNLIVIEQEILTKTGTLIETALSKGPNNSINSTDILKLVDYYNAKIEKSKTNIYNYRIAQQKINEQIAGLNTRIEDIMAKATPKIVKPYGQLFLQVMCKKAGEIPVSLSYYTNNAGWTPLYDIRVNSKTNRVKLVYKASVTQTSGIDWKKTKLTLSTGTPNFGVVAPILTPWYLQQYVPEIYKQLQSRAAGVNVQRNMLNSMRDDSVLGEVVVTGYGTDRRKELTGATQTIDPSTLQQYTTLNEGQLNTNFEIDLPYDIESDGQLHSVTIKNEEINSTLKNYSVPRADKDAYLLAEVPDWQNLDLLPGEANIIMDDTYIGKSMIDPNTTADTMNLSLGRDKRVVVKRTIVKDLSSTKTNGKESRQNFTYEITVKNNKLTDVNLLLKDQYPLSNLKEVEVKLDDDVSGGTVNNETGVLTWKITLKAGESKKIRYSYNVKYPKDMKIFNLK